MISQPAYILVNMVILIIGIVCTEKIERIFNLKPSTADSSSPIRAVRSLLAQFSGPCTEVRFFQTDV